MDDIITLTVEIEKIILQRILYNWCRQNDIIHAIYGNLLKFPSTQVVIRVIVIIAWHKQSVRIYILIYTEMSSLINNALQQHA